MRRRTLLGLVGTAGATSLAGCLGIFENASSSYENGTKIGCSGDAYPDRIQFDCRRYDGEAGRIFTVDAGTTIALTCATDLANGAVRFVVKGPDDDVLWEHSVEEPGRHEERGTVQADQQGRYHMRVEADDAEGSFELDWDLRE